MGDVAFAYQLAELEQVSKLRAQCGILSGDNRRYNGLNNGNKYNNINNTYRPNNNNNNNNNTNNNNNKVRRTNSGGDGMLYSHNGNANRRQRNVNQVSNQNQGQQQQQRQQQQNYYRGYDNSQFQHQMQHIQQFQNLQQFDQIQPPRPASQPNSGLTSQFLESLLVQQLARSQTPTQLSQTQPQSQQSQSTTINTSFPFYETSTGTSSPTSALLHNHNAFSSAPSGTFDSPFPSLQSHVSFNDLSIYQPTSQSNVTTPSSTTSKQMLSSASSAASQFQPHQLMNFIFSDPTTPLSHSSTPTPVTPVNITRPESVLRSTSENSSGGGSNELGGLVDPLESIWKKDSSSTNSNNSTLGLTSQSLGGDNDRSIGSYF